MKKLFILAWLYGLDLFILVTGVTVGNYLTSKGDITYYIIGEIMIWWSIITSVLIGFSPIILQYFVRKLKPYLGLFFPS
jgi:dolichyl-phosphate-mannose--protein O-mannosyl transferase